MSTSLGLNIGAATTYVPNATFAPQPVPRNAAVAFLLSLLLPGLGQFYCRKKSRAAWTLGAFLVCAISTILLTPQLVGGKSAGAAVFWGILFRAAVFLYGFAFLDAYFTAREMSAGTDPFIVEIPRIAAILNLLTRGFGYFYLGQRALGFAVFIGLGIFQQVVGQGMAGNKEAGTSAALIIEVVLAGLGIHAYRIGRKREKEILATIQPTPQAPTSGLPAAIPISLAGLLGTAYIGLCCVGLFLPDYSIVDQSRAKLSEAAGSVTYANSLYNIRFSAPPSWTLSYEDTKGFISGGRNDQACFAELRSTAWSPLLTLNSYNRALTASLGRPESKGSRILQTSDTTLSGLSARDISLILNQQGVPIAEHQIIARHYLSLHILTLDALQVPGADCRSDFAFIQQNLALH